MSQHENELESFTEYTRQYLAGVKAGATVTGKDPNGWHWKDKMDTPDTDAMPTKWTYTPTPPVTPEEDEWFGERHPWNNPTFERGSHGEKVHARPVEPLSVSARMIAAECDRIKAFLIEKNLAYGNSALDPVRIFSSASTVEQLLVRIDDKLSRMEHGFEHGDDDTTLDLIGYLILLRIAVGREGQ